MKQKLSVERVCLVFTLFVALQLTSVLFFKITFSLTQEQKNLARNTCNGSLPMPWSLIQSIQGKSIICDRSHEIYEWCHLNRPTILDSSRATFFTIGSRSLTPARQHVWEKIRPYPRKWENHTMSIIREITLTTAPLHKRCEIYHNTPALVFSVSGYTGNFFHDFNDVIVPLYITINTHFHQQDVTLVVTDFSNWWYSKYKVLLRQLSKHRVINLNNQTSTHCFPSAVVGLISHGPMTIDPVLLPQPKTFFNFRAMLEAAYNRCHVVSPPPLRGKPRLIFVSRTGRVGRVILNQDKVLNAIKEIGFDVVIFKPNRFTYLCDAYRLINSSHGMFGIHGAALTHSLFLRPGSMFIQVVPLGNDWLANTYFKSSARGLGLEYTEYKIKEKESSLIDKYGMKHKIVTDPNAIVNGNWSALDSIYLKGQDVRLDLSTLRVHLRVAYEKAKRFMDRYA